MPYRTIIFSKQGHIASITLNRPRTGNAVNPTMAQEIEEVCRSVNQDDDIYAVTITGRGSAFCAGGDIREEGQYHPAESIAAIDRPVIAALNGDALGEGLEMALSCDIRLASAKAHFGLLQAATGQMPADGGTQRLPRLIGKGKALELSMTAEIISAREALEIGLVSRVCEPEALDGEVQKLAETIGAKGPIALRYLKEAINKGLDLTLEQGLRLEADLYFLLHTTADRTEGIRSYLEKRKPEYRGK
ncbi:MAG: enoyl-CoA hydratase-related protein [Dehalococcoidales bacterium]